MEIRPLRAYRFDESVVGNVGSCIAPPYDVISDAEQEQLYQKSEYNIVRITKGKTTPADDAGNNQYTRAAAYLKSWIEKGVLKQDSADTIYGYVQDFQVAGTYYQRFSFVALGKLEEFGDVVRPHEQILNEPLIDRLKLKRATGARFGLVFMLYEDERNVAEKIIENAAGRKPLIDFVDDQGVRHRLFAITAKEDIDAIAQMMADKSCIIADGHHRYTTGLTYSKESSDPAARYQMLAFTNIRHEGLVILATHRLVNSLDSFDFKKMLSDLKENFEVTEYHFDSPQTRTDARQKMLAQMKAEHDDNRNAFGIYGGSGAFYVAVLKNRQAMDKAAPEKSRAWRSLDVPVLHKLILEELLGIGEKELAAGSNVQYVKDTSDAVNDSIARVDAGQKQAAFFMNPTKIEQIQMVTEQGERMPQKSTYFYPKVYTGLTISKL
ncbi:MAG TPA: DUF1015 domain-containing protein [Sedimentisphaerales bacterium]|nr:DUF1015 domain-containing protein [Sedimentisphaerales bacterium]